MFQMQFSHLCQKSLALSAPLFRQMKQQSIPDILPFSFEYHYIIIWYPLLTIILQNFHDVFDLSFCILRLHSENILKLSSFFSFIILMMPNILIHVKAKIWPLLFSLSIQLALDILLVSHIPHKCLNLFSYVAFEFCTAVKINNMAFWVMRPYCNPIWKHQYSA